MCRCLSDEFLCVCRCIKTFEVEFCSDQTEFSRINPQDTIFTSYVHSPGENDSKEQQNWIMFTFFKLHVTLTVCVSCRVVLCRVVSCCVVLCLVVLCSEPGGRRSVQSSSCGLLGTSRVVLAAWEVLRGSIDGSIFTSGVLNDLNIFSRGQCADCLCDWSRRYISQAGSFVCCCSSSAEYCDWI